MAPDEHAPAAPGPDLGEALSRIEETILPSLATLLDGLIAAATPELLGEDARFTSAELHTIALHLEELTQAVEALSPPASPLQPDCARRISA